MMTLLGGQSCGQPRPYKILMIDSFLFSLSTTDTQTMDFSKLGFVLFYGISMVMGGPRYIAIPIDGLDIFELNPIVSPSARLPRQTVSTDSIENPVQRPQAHILDYVDFGAHTGANGAYSWHADYPSHH